MTHATCRLIVKNRDQLRNRTFGNRVWATFTFTFYISPSFRRVVNTTMLLFGGERQSIGGVTLERLAAGGSSETKEMTVYTATIAHSGGDDDAKRSIAARRSWRGRRCDTDTARLVSSVNRRRTCCSFSPSAPVLSQS